MHKTGTHDTTFDDLADSLVWPLLLRAARLALRPARLGLAVILLILVALVGQIPSLWLGGSVSPAHTAAHIGQEGVAALSEGMVSLAPAQVASGASKVFVAAPAAAARAHPWSTLAIAIPIMLVWGVLGGAISRSTATEFALRIRTPWTSALAFGVSKWGSFFSCSFAPLAITLLLTGLLGVAGWLLLGWSYVNLLGGLLYGLAVLLAGAITLFSLGILLGAPMLIPAVACEGSDAIDAIQRTLAYAAAKPVRLVLYLAVALVQLVIVTWALAAIAHAITSLAAHASTLLLPADTATYFTGRALGLPHEGESSGTQRAAGSLLAFWSALPTLLVAAFAVSYWFTSGTMLYLAMRRICDAQDPTELWTEDRPASTLPSPPPITDGDDDDE